MFFFLSKFLPLFIYPLGVACLLLLALLLRRGRARRERFALLLAFLALWLGGNRWVSLSLARSLEWQYVPAGDILPAEIIVVLGGATRSPHPPRPTVEVGEAGDRLIYAAQLYHQGKAPYLLVTGGILPFTGETATEADSMAALLRLLGVPDTAIWRETQAVNTYENAVYTRELLSERGIDRAILVTSALHMPRAVGVFTRQGITVTPAPADFSLTERDWQGMWGGNVPAFLLGLLPDAHNLELTTRALKEYLGLLIYRLRGWL